MSMYIMCVGLFSALSRRVGALQIYIIIIIKGNMLQAMTFLNVRLQDAS